MKVISYSFDSEKRIVTIIVKEDLSQESILYFFDNKILNLGDINTREKKGNKVVFRIQCSSDENFLQLHEILRKEIIF
ncbi:MAG: hypothetical protein HFJ34_08980 [Clostridia bacterium]|nr:hypothetical protein [Clostridia bacterium]